MAIAGGGIPSRTATIRRRELRLGMAQNTPKSVVQSDMVLAAEALRRNPDALVRVDALRVNDLIAYLKNSNHIDR